MTMDHPTCVACGLNALVYQQLFSYQAFQPEEQSALGWRPFAAFTDNIVYLADLLASTSLYVMELSAAFCTICNFFSFDNRLMADARTLFGMSGNSFESTSCGMPCTSQPLCSWISHKPTQPTGSSPTSGMRLKRSSMALVARSMASSRVSPPLYHDINCKRTAA